MRRLSDVRNTICWRPRPNRCRRRQSIKRNRRPPSQAAWSCWGRPSPPFSFWRRRAVGLSSRAKAQRRPRPRVFPIVVMPFANLRGDPAQDYLVDALTDELTTSLARISARLRPFVIARNTAITYKGKPMDAKVIGKDLGVRYVLEGSVQPSGDQAEGQRPAHRRRQRRSPLGRTIRHPPRRSVADAGRDRHASGARDGGSTHRGRGRPSQTDARGESRRRGLGSPMLRGRAEGRIYRQGSRCGIRSLQAGARTSIPTMSAP